MPPHCDTLDGPVVSAARKALETGNVNFILPWVAKKGEPEVKKAFEKTLLARKLGKPASGLADRWFFETAVRVHRTGEGQPYTGLKPAGLDWGPVVRRAEESLELGDAGEVIEFILEGVHHELHERFKKALFRKGFDINDVAAAREYVQSMLSFVLYSHHLYAYAMGEGESGEGSGGHRH